MSTIVNGTISDKLHIMSGMCSTFLPGKKGEEGDRAPVTFSGSSDSELGDTTIMFELPKHDSSIYITNTLGLSPIPYDYIIYAESGKTYLLYVTSILQSSIQSRTDVTVNIMDVWETTASNPEEQGTINVSIGCIKRSITRKYLSRGVTTSPEISNGYYVSGTVNINRSGLIQYCFNFSVTSKNSQNLGNFKIQLEFNTTQSSPAMDTLIASKFTDPLQNIENQINDEIEEADHGERATPSYTEKLTFRGYMGNYSCKSLNGTYNFDSEKLDDFTIIIKNYNDGINSQNYTKDVYLPINVIKDARSNGHKYTCKIYGYLQSHDNIYNKLYIGDITDSLYDVIDDEEENEHQNN